MWIKVLGRPFVMNRFENFGTTIQTLQNRKRSFQLLQQRWKQNSLIKGIVRYNINIRFEWIYWNRCYWNILLEGGLNIFVHIGPDLITACGSTNASFSIKKTTVRIYLRHAVKICAENGVDSCFFSGPYCICICSSFLFRHKYYGIIMGIQRNHKPG